MGSCVSVHKSSESAMKLGLSFGSKNDKVEIPPSPVKEKPAGGDIRIKDVALTAWTPSPSAKTFGDYGSKDEAFFDSNPWLESDCEDDFYSVNGDFTPSRGNTPAHQGIAAKANKTPFEARLPETNTNTNTTATTTPSPTVKKKRLLELFKESVRDDEEQAKNRCSVATTPNFLSGANSGCSSERTANVESINYGNGDDEKKPMRARQCCLPSLVSCRSFSERKKKNMSPAIAVNQRA